MPKIFLPQRSDAHRIACTALYRALLKQCHELTSTTAAAGQTITTHPLENLIRYRFQRDKKLRSPNQIRDALTRGQSSLTILLNVNSGSSAALTELVQILRKTSDDAETTAGSRQPRRETHTPPKPTPKAIHNEAARSKANQEPGPDFIGLSAHPFPLSALKSQSRIVPSLVSAQKNIPFLRYGKQPIFLSRVIRQKQKWLENTFSRIQMLDDLKAQGLAEDEWDVMTYRQAGAEFGDATARSLFSDLYDSWARAPIQASKDLYRKLRVKEGKSAELGERMWEIVKQEQRLKNWEDLPFNVAKAVKDIRKLEIRIYQFTQRHGTKYQFKLRPHNVPITAQVEAKQMGRFDIPVEWAIRKEKKSSEYYKELEASLADQPDQRFGTNRASIPRHYGKRARNPPAQRQNLFGSHSSESTNSESPADSFTPFGQTVGRRTWQQRFQREK